MNRRSFTPVSEPIASPNVRQRGWFFACFYWAAQGIYGLFAAALCYFLLGVIVSIVSPALTPLAARLLTAGVAVISVLVGVQAAYGNHRWIQRRELAKRNA